MARKGGTRDRGRAKVWGLREEALCTVHAGRRAPEQVPVEMAPAHEGPADVGRVPTLDEEIARLVASRDKVDRWLEERLEGCEPAEAVRYLVALALVARSLAAMLMQRKEGGDTDKLDRLLAEAARVVRERHAAR